MRIRWLAAIAGTAAVTCACSSGAHPASRSAAPTTAPATTPTVTASTATPGLPTAELRCSDVIGTDPPTSGMQIVADAVALPSLRQPALGAGNTGQTGTDQFFAKYGLLIRARTKAVLTVADPDHVSIGWGNPGPEAKRFVIPGCGSSGWLAFAGGYYVDQPRCITLQVSSGSVQQDVRIGVGAPCPGQRPPIEPPPA